VIKAVVPVLKLVFLFFLRERIFDEIFFFFFFFCFFTKF